VGENRKQVLEMLAAGKITVAEAEALIDALERDEPKPLTADSTARKARPRYLRVVVESPEHAGRDWPGRVNVRVPMQLLRAGVRMTHLIPPQALGPANRALRQQGIDVDLAQLKPQQFEELIERLDEVTVDLDQPDVRVKLSTE
jgi:galactose-1-phosphate uridylyltransferase